jgi:hypothetical protein
MFVPEGAGDDEGYAGGTTLQSLVRPDAIRLDESDADGFRTKSRPQDAQAPILGVQ